jgi:hypothetical protein
MLPLIPLAISILPDIAQWLFGSGAEKTTAAVTKAVADVTGVDTSTEAGMTAAVATLQGKPELAGQLQVQLAQIAATAKADADKAAAAALATELADVANARAQTVALATARSPIAWAPVVISAAVLFTFAAVMFLALTRALPAGSETLLNMLLGSLTAMATGAVNYWLGSSSGSAQKTDLLFKSAPALPPSPQP